MKRHSYIAILVIGILGLLPTWAQDTAEAPLRLTLPSEFYAVPGVETGIYFDNIVLTETPEAYRFSVTCDLGASEERRWTATPTAAQVGAHTLSVTVADAAGAVLGRAQTTLKVIPANAGAKSSIKLLIVGDSLTHATVYPKEIGRLLASPDNPTWRMLGTNTRGGESQGVFHEGYGGWTWNRFATKYEPNPDGTYKKRSSPFIFLGPDDKPALDVARYYDENTKGERPDVITILLGINDCFGAKPDDPANIDARIDTMFGYAKTLIEAFRKTAPDAEIGICLTPPGNSRESGFFANYKGKYTRWGWKRIQHRLVERQIELFKGREAENLFIIPTELYLDPVDGYPTNNGVHPNRTGYKQIGSSIYAWIKSRLHARGTAR